MRHIFSFIFTLLPCIIVSCIIIDEVINEMPSNIYNSETKANINDLPKSNLSLYFVNAAENITLNIDSCEMYNIKLFSVDSNGFILTKKSNLTLFNDYYSLPFKDTLRIDNIILPLQNINPWNPMIYPLNNNGSYIKLYGNILMENNFSIFSGEMFIPISGKIKETEKNSLYLILSDGCPWYGEVNGKMETLLNSIKFNVTVQGWNEITYDDITL